MLSWKSGTKIISPTKEAAIEYFTSQFNKGLGLESSSLAREALSVLGINFDGFCVGNHLLVIRYMKEVFAARRSQPLYSKCGA